MSFVLLKNHNHYAIVNDDADFIVGRVYPLNGRHGPYRVSADVGPLDRETTEAGIVKSLEEAIPAFLAYDERYPLPCDWIYDVYDKSTLFVNFRVEQDQQGHWLAYRDGYPMLRHGEPAHFATYTDAQRAADAHD